MLSVYKVFHFDGRVCAIETSVSIIIPFSLIVLLNADRVCQWASEHSLGSIVEQLNGPIGIQRNGV